jgi:RimJ/RimL family protein N-acetyltransferase
MRLRRAHDTHAELPWEDDIRREAPPAGEERRILQARERRADVPGGDFFHNPPGIGPISYSAVMEAVARPSLFKTFVRVLSAWTRLEYACYKMFRTELASYEMPPHELPHGYSVSRVTRADVEQATHPAIADLAGFGGPDSLGFAVLRDGEIVSVSWAWHGARYRDERNFWPLGPRDAKMMQTFTIPEERGRGFTLLLMHRFAHELKLLGFERVFTRIWWNHSASIRVAQKMGRRHIATVVELRAAGRRLLRFVRRHHP